MTDNEPLHMSFDNLPRAVAELHSKIDTLTEMVEKQTPHSLCRRS